MRTGGELIREARKRAGLSQRELAERLGTTQSVIARWETGVRSPTVETLLRAVRACGLDLNITLGAPDPDHELLIRENRRLTPSARLDRMVDQTAGLVDLLRYARGAGGPPGGDPGAKRSAPSRRDR
jgi:transcriptional regulator with XRE-family HTH domain